MFVPQPDLTGISPIWTVALVAVVVVTAACVTLWGLSGSRPRTENTVRLMGALEGLIRAFRGDDTGEREDPSAGRVSE